MVFRNISNRLIANRVTKICQSSVYSIVGHALQRLNSTGPAMYVPVVFLTFYPFHFSSFRYFSLIATAFRSSPSQQSGRVGNRACSEIAGEGCRGRSAFKRCGRPSPASLSRADPPQIAFGEGEERGDYPPHGRVGRSEGRACSKQVAKIVVSCMAFCLAFATVPTQAQDPLRPFLQSRCADCHEGTSAVRELDLESLALPNADTESLRKWSMIYQRVAEHQMPPADVNGTVQGIETMTDKGKIIGGKSKLTNAGTHVPLIVNWTGQLKAGTVSDALVDMTD